MPEAFALSWLVRAVSKQFAHITENIECLVVWVGQVIPLQET